MAALSTFPVPTKLSSQISGQEEAKGGMGSSEYLVSIYAAIRCQVSDESEGKIYKQSDLATTFSFTDSQAQVSGDTRGNGELLEELR